MTLEEALTLGLELVCILVWPAILILTGQTLIRLRRLA